MSAALRRARRSSLILPVNVPRFVERAALRGEDAVVLDLEDSVPSTEKANARRLVLGALALAGRGGAEVVVRVNNDPALLWDDFNLDGKMVDIPVYKRAQVILARARVVEKTERHKAEARARLH